MSGTPIKAPPKKTSPFGNAVHDVRRGKLCAAGENPTHSGHATVSSGTFGDTVTTLRTVTDCGGRPRTTGIQTRDAAPPASTRTRRAAAFCDHTNPTRVDMWHHVDHHTQPKERGVLAVGDLTSIQGEQQKARAQRYDAEIEDIEDYVSNAPDEILECREDVHRFPTTRSGITFTSKESGFYIREVTCTRCGRAVRRETWTTRGTGQNRRWEMVDRGLRYIKVDGISYLAKPKSGRMPKRKIRNAWVTQQLSGFTNIRELDRQLIHPAKPTLKAVRETG